MREPHHPIYSRPSGYFSSHANLFRSTQIRVTLYASERRRKRSCVLFLFFFFFSFPFFFFFYSTFFSIFSFFLLLCVLDKNSTHTSLIELDAYVMCAYVYICMCMCLLRKWPIVVTFIYKTNLERHRCRTQ